MDHEIYAPFNFVPFSNKILEYPWKEGPPSYSKICSDLLTGQLDITMTAVTPVCIGNGDKGNPGFFRDAEGQYAIPGSSLRGLIRENMQILGHGCIVTVQNRDIEVSKQRRCLANGLDPIYKQRMLDLVTGILGYADLDIVHGDKKGNTQKESRRSRVSFGNLRAQEDAKPQEPFKLLLMSPTPVQRGNCSKNYTLRTGESGNQFILRGYKQYWLKPEEAWNMDDRNASTMNVMPAGTCFQGTITFRNLHPEELGLVLWALRLEDGCFQPIGRGKPYGFGRMRLTIDSMYLMDTKTLYSLSVSGLTSGLTKADPEKISEYIGKFKELSQDKLKEDWDCNLKDFFYIRSAEHQYGYMSSNTSRSRGASLPTIAEIAGLRAEVSVSAPEPESKVEIASDPPKTLEQSKEALRMKYGGVSAATTTAPKKKKKRR